MKPRVLIVDGHSMIFRWPQLTREHGRNTSAAREHLVRLLTGLQDASDWHVAVVFDGKGSKAGDSSEPGGIHVFYSKAGQTADSIIERLAAKYASQYEVTVATDDSLERTTVMTFGASAMSSVQLAEMIRDSENDLQTRIRSIRKRAR